MCWFYVNHLCVFIYTHIIHIYINILFEWFTPYSKYMHILYTLSPIVMKGQKRFPPISTRLSAFKERGSFHAYWLLWSWKEASAAVLQLCMDWLLVYGTMSTWERTSKHGNEEVADLYIYMTSPDITIDFNDSTGECRGELAKQTSIIDILSIIRHNWSSYIFSKQEKNSRTFWTKNTPGNAGIIPLPKQKVPGVSLRRPVAGPGGQKIVHRHLCSELGTGFFSKKNRITRGDWKYPPWN